MNLEDKVKWAGREEKGISPVDFFRQHYDDNTTRSQLARQDFALYKILSGRGLLDEAIPNFNQKSSEKGKVGGSVGTRDFGDDPIAYYSEHYDGLTRGELSKKDPSLY